MRVRALLLLVAVAGAAACARKGPMLLPYVVQDAAAQRKPLVVEFYASWCGPCRHFEEKILPDPRVQAALADVVFVRYNIETTAGRDAFRRCRGRRLPTVVGIDARGVVRLYKTGTELTADQFLNFLRQTQEVLGHRARN